VQTEDVFREANERIAGKADELNLQPPIPFLCECSDEHCFVRLFLSLEEYAEVRSDPPRFVASLDNNVPPRLRTDPRASLSWPPNDC
jgi:hypothetical protein